MHRTLLIATLLVVAGCDSSPDTVPLDLLLQNALADAGGADLYTMPDAADLAAIPQDPRNPLTPEKVALGRVLFHETALAVNAARPEGMGTYSCASCHHAGAAFQAGVPQGIGEGGVGFGRFGERRVRHTAYAADELDIQPVRTPTALNGAFQDVMLWNGQFGATGTNAGTEASWTPDTPIATNALGFEGLETQAIAGLTVHRMADGAAAVYAAYPEYRRLFDAAFPEAPAAERATAVTAGLAIAAYERTLLATEAPFQRWLRGEAGAMTSAQKRGAVVFFAEANCTSCHSGPGLAGAPDGPTSFHALGMGDLVGPGVFSDFNPTDPVRLGRGGFTKRPADDYLFKTSQLYNLADHGFYGHGASLNTVREVVEYKNAAVPENAAVPAGRLSPLFVPQGLTRDQVDDLVIFLTQGLYDADLARYVPDALPSGNCFPNDDAQTQADLGCGVAARVARPLSLIGRGRQTGAAGR